MEAHDMGSRLIDSDILVRIEDCTPNSKLLYLCLAIQNGGHISRIYKFSVGVMVGLTGMTMKEVKASLEELESEKLIEVDRDNKIVWVIHGLEDEKNKNNWVLDGVEKQLENLSSSPLVDRFRLRYASILTDLGSDSPSNWADKRLHGDSSETLKSLSRDSSESPKSKSKRKNIKIRKGVGDYDPVFNAFWEGLKYKRGSKRGSEKIFLRVLSTKGDEEAAIMTACMKNYESYVDDVLRRRDDFGVDKVLHVKTFLNGDRYIEFETRYWKKNESKGSTGRVDRAVDSVTEEKKTAGGFGPDKMAARGGPGMGRLEV